MLNAALKLFRDRGYDRVKLEEVAEEAEVSVGTVYTYFKTKNALLLAVIVDDFDHAYASAQRITESPIADAESAIDALCQCYFYEEHGDISRQIWCFAVSAFLREPNSEFGVQYSSCLSNMRQQYVAMLERLQTDGFLQEGADGQILANLIYNNANYCYIEYLRDDTMPMCALMTRIRKFNEHILRMSGCAS